MQYLARAESIARWSVFLLFFLVPIFFVPVSWMSIVQSKALLTFLLATVGFLAWVMHSLDSSVVRIPKSALVFATTLIPIAYLVSALATGASWEAFLGSGGGQDTVLVFMFLYLVFFTTAGTLGGSHTTRALRLFLVGALSVIVIQLIHLVVPAFGFGGALPVPASSVIGSWHDLGLFLVLSIFVSLALHRSVVLAGVWRFVAILIILSALAFLVIISFEGLWLLLFIFSILGLAFTTRHVLKNALPSRQSILWWGGCSVIALGMYFGTTAVHEMLPEPVQVLHVEVRPSWQGTLAVGQGIFSESNRILFGSGPNSFFRAWEMYKPLSVNETQFWNTQFNYGVGFVPTSFVTTGAVGIVAWLAVFGALLWGMYRAFKDSVPDHHIRTALVIGALFLAVAHILHVPGFALSLLMFLFFGAFVAHERSLGAIREWAVGVPWETAPGKVLTVFLVLVSITIFTGGVQVVRALVSDAFVNRAIVQYNETQDRVLASRSLAWALGILPQNDRAHRSGVELGLVQLNELSLATEASEEVQAELEATLQATIQHGLSAVSIGDRNYQNWLTLAHLYGELAGVGVEGAEKEAREAYAEAKAKNPTSPLPYTGLAQLEIASGNDAAAREQLEVALGFKQNFALARYLLSQVYARAGDFEQAKEHAVLVPQLVPQDPLGWYNLGLVLYLNGEFEEAITTLERTISIQNTHANALFFLGLAYHQVGRSGDALKALKVVETLNPGNRVLLETMAQIEAETERGGSDSAR